MSWQVAAGSAASGSNTSRNGWVSYITRVPPGFSVAGDLAHEQRHIRHPAEYADGHQGDIEALV